MLLSGNCTVVGVVVSVDDVSHTSSFILLLSLQAMCAIGDSVKRGNFTKDGRHGVGMNTMYHLSDQPVLLTGPDSDRRACFFDPLLAYAAGSMSDWHMPGVKYTEEQLRRDFPDQLDGLGEGRLREVDVEQLGGGRVPSGTRFRLPLRKLNDDAERVRARRLKSTAAPVRAEVVLKDLRKWASKVGDDYFLFGKSIERITVVHLGADERNELIFARAAKRTLLPVPRGIEFFQNAVTVPVETSFYKDLPTSEQEVRQAEEEKSPDRLQCFELTVENSLDATARKYLVGLYFRAAMLKNSLDHLAKTGFALLPVGGAAIPLGTRISFIVEGHCASVLRCCFVDAVDNLRNDEHHLEKLCHSETRHCKSVQRPRPKLKRKRGKPTQSQYCLQILPPKPGPRAPPLSASGLCAARRRISGTHGCMRCGIWDRPGRAWTSRQTGSRLGTLTSVTTF